MHKFTPSLALKKLASGSQAIYVRLPGTLFLQLLQCLIIPLVIPSLIVAVGSLDLSLTGKIGARCLSYKSYKYL
jgi:Na+/H+-dicarboxylate symporter